MKTAMQKAIEIVKKYDNREILYNVMVFNLELLLEKEKEQIIQAYEDGKQNGVESIFNVNAYIIGEYYYNQTYNQNK